MFRAGPVMPCTVRQFSWAGLSATFPSQRICLSCFLYYSRSLGRCQDFFTRLTAGYRKVPGGTSAGDPLCKLCQFFRFYPGHEPIHQKSGHAAGKNSPNQNIGIILKHFARSAARASASEPPRISGFVPKGAHFVNAGLSCQRRAMRRPGRDISGILFPSGPFFRLIPFLEKLKPWSNGLRLSDLLILIPAHWIHSFQRKVRFLSGVALSGFPPGGPGRRCGKTGTDFSVVPFLSAVLLYEIIWAKSIVFEKRMKIFSIFFSHIIFLLTWGHTQRKIIAAQTK